MLLELDNEFFKCFPAPGDLSHYYEDVEDRSNLLVTIGDSWTWGDMLGTTCYKDGHSDPNRENWLYGRHLQNFIGDCDWINIGYPGTGNRWIVDVALRFQRLAAIIRHERIIISIGMTDIARDHNQRGPHPQANGSWRASLELYERDYFQQILSLDHDKITKVIGRNFTSSFPANIHMLPNHLSKRWIDVSRDHWPDGIDPGVCHAMDFPDRFSLINEQIWATEVGIPQSLQVTDFLLACPWHYKKISKHPTPEGHRFWAEYVYSSLITCW